MWFKADSDIWERLVATFPTVWPISARLLDVAYYQNRARQGQQSPTQEELAERWGCSRAAVARTLKKSGVIQKPNKKRTKSEQKREGKPARLLDSPSQDRTKSEQKANKKRSLGATQRAYQEEKRKEPLSLKDKGFLSTEKSREKEGGEPAPLRGPNPPTRIEIGSVEEGKRFLLAHKEQLKAYRGDRIGAIRYFQTQTKSATTVIEALGEFGGWTWL